MLVALVPIAWGHPFESQFVGHKSTLEVHPTHLELEFDLEIPLPLVERAYQESGQADKRVWFSDWMRIQQLDMEEYLWLEVNDIRQAAWTNVVHEQPAWKEEAKFLVFRATLDYRAPEEIQSILLLDQVFIGEPSVYWHDIQLSRDIVVLATDTIEINGDRYKTHLKRWEMEESRREVRLAIAQSLWSRLDGWWRCTVLSQSSIQTMKEAFLPQDVWRSWTLGKTPLWIGIFSVVMVIVTAVKGTYKSTVGLCLVALAGSTMPVLPVNFRLTLIGLISLGLFNRRWCTTVLGCVLILICQPSWVLMVGLLLGLVLKHIFRT